MVNDIEHIKGVGPKTKQYLAKLDIYDINGLISHYPFRYEVLKRSDLLSLKQNDKIIIDGIIETIPVMNRFKGKMDRMSFRLRTEQSMMSVIIFNRGFLLPNLKIGRMITVIGKWDKIKNTIVASDILFEGLGNKIKIEPVYHTTNGLNKKVLRNYIIHALDINNGIKDNIPSYLVSQYAFMDKKMALKVVHQPSNIQTLKKALIRLKYEELFMFMLKINYLKLRNTELKTGYAKEFDQNKAYEFIAKLPFELTIDQRQATNDIIDDIKSAKRMNRLLQGDVGSGKTIVSIIAIYTMHLAGYQSALMAPTEILARQHYNNVKEIMSKTDLKVELLIGSSTKGEKKKIYDRLAAGEVDLIIGTHALIQEEVKYYNLGLVVTDEQHRFGVNQRANLKNKGKLPDVLYMSATPIPRTYALTIYGDMDISIIKTIPLGRKKIKTYLKSHNDIKEILLMINRELDLNHQIYVIAPLIEESDKVELENVNKLRHQFNLAFGKKYRIGMLHGKLSVQEKDNIMNQFLRNEINILISTTVIEVGIDVKNATTIVIFDADRFGLSTIHQLRGRVGRSELQSYCILVGEKEKERLKILTKTHDGFEISEADFKLRGHGDLFGIRQSGDMSFKIADLKKDFKILLKAKEDSMTFIEKGLINKYTDIKKELYQNVSLN
jgi:ATP-dependent DNA helicase RecG